MGVFLSKGFGTTGHLTTLSYALHKISHRKVLFDVIYRVEFSSVVYGMGIF